MIFQNLLKRQLFDKNDKKQGCLIFWIELLNSHEGIIKELNFNSDKIQNAEAWRFNVVEKMADSLF